MGRTSSSASGYSFCLEGEMAWWVIIYQFMGCGRWFSWVVRDLEGTWLEGCWQGSLQKRYVDFSEWVKNMNIFVSCINAQQRVTTAEDDFNKWITIGHFKPPLSLPSEWPWWQVGGYDGVNNMDFNHQGWPGYSHCQVLSLQRPTLHLWYDYSLEWWASYLMAGWLHWTASVMEEATICFYWNWHSGHGFAFLAHNASAQTNIFGLNERLIHHHGIPHSVGSGEGTQLYSKWS